MARSTKMSAKDKYERQKELARERQKMFRKKMTEEKREQKKNYDRDRISRMKKEGKVKTISDLTPRGQKEMRTYRRGRNKARSQRIKMLAEVAEDTPPASLAESDSVRKKVGRKQVRGDRAKAYRAINKQK